LVAQAASTASRADGRPTNIVERPSSQLVPFEQDPKTSSRRPRRACQRRRQPPTPAPKPGGQPAKQPPLVATEQLHLTLTDTSAASNQEPSMTPAERHPQPAKRPPPPPPPLPGKGPSPS
jgi:hypothetical protein